MFVEFGQSSAEGSGQHPSEENICFIHVTDALFISSALIFLIVFGGGLPTSLLHPPLPSHPIENALISECDAVLARFFTVLYVISDYGMFIRLISIWERRCLVECRGGKGANTPRCVEL